MYSQNSRVFKGFQDAYEPCPLRPGHTRRQVAATRRGDKSPQQIVLCDTINFMKIIVAAAEFCRRDQSHEFKPV